MRVGSGLVEEQRGGPFTTALVLTHGARGDLDALRLPLYAAAAADAGVPCLRVTLHMRDITARAMAMEGVMLKAAQLHPALKDVRRWVAGGHSVGARAAARVAAAVNGAARGPAGADDAAKALRGAGHRVTGLLLSSFPAHAPGRPDELYDRLLDELYDRLLVGLKLPMLFFRGTRDNSSTQDAWERLRARLQTKDIEARTRARCVAVVEGGDHMLRIAKGGAKQGAVDAQLSTALQAFLASHLKDSGGKGGDGGGSGGDEPGGGGPGGNGEVNVRRLRRARRAVH
ncbi:MAG: hypothetical protein J3K34DRAFT_475993 [Monoraphidium minutum]|nr:MAG: hypothetical protein J3K34DRAFT_475993 [Monoraphidium minutum]